jgi:rRNA-processing protein FCF1
MNQPETPKVRSTEEKATTFSISEAIAHEDRVNPIRQHPVVTHDKRLASVLRRIGTPVKLINE